jgi:hypothetical protein
MNAGALVLRSDRLSWRAVSNGGERVTVVPLVSLLIVGHGSSRNALTTKRLNFLYIVASPHGN